MNTVGDAQSGGILLGGDHLLADAGYRARRLDGRYDAGLAMTGGALVFGAALAVLAVLYFWTGLSRVLLFWAAFILTRPLGATMGDFLDKPLQDGGLAFSRPVASAIIAAFIVGCILLLPQRAGQHPGASHAATGRSASSPRTGRPSYIPRGVNHIFIRDVLTARLAGKKWR